MIIPDVNLLLYATDRQSPFHGEARKWWQATLLGKNQIGFCSPVLFAFLRLATHPKIFLHPLTIDRAFSHLENWM